MQTKYNKEIEFLLEFGNSNYIKNLSFPTKKFSNLNWNYIFNQADYHQISPYIYVNLKKSDASVPKEFKKEFKLRYITSLSQYIYLEYAFKELASKLINEKTEFVPLKGFALAGFLYKDPTVRPVTDIDILVKQEDLHKIHKILAKHGYKKTFAGLSDKYYREYHCHYMYVKNGILIEVHWALSFDKPNKIVIPELWERTDDFKIHGLTLKNLSKEDTLLALLLHQRRFDKPLYLKTLLDISILLKKFKNQIDWNYVIKLAIKNKLKSLFFLILFIVNKLFSTPVPKEIFDKFYPGNIKKKIIQIIIENYIFHTENDSIAFRKKFYLILNFIWYDTLWDILVYLLWLSQEKFAKYYNLKPYSYKTKYLYKIRSIFIPFNAFLRLFRKLKFF